MGWGKMGVVWMVMVVIGVSVVAEVEVRKMSTAGHRHRHAYAAMMYMGTPRDYEFYVALRVMMRSLAELKVDADLVVIASVDVPIHWQRTMKKDGLKVVTVQNLKNPCDFRGNVSSRFRMSLNKLYAWSLVEYDRVVMIDSDNIFLRKTDELFQCGTFCAVFLNPCVFHTGLFVLKPSMAVFRDMLREVEVRRVNRDGADQGFLSSYFSDLLDRPMFHPPANGSRLDGTFRLPYGYQMDASLYYLKLRWRVPCGPNSVITFPSLPWFKPWYWWSWPILPLGLSWHEQRHKTLGYGAEMPAVLIEAAMYLSVIWVGRTVRPSLAKLCYNREAENLGFLLGILKLVVMGSILVSHIVPFMLVPRTVHPVLGWCLYLLGSWALSSIVINAFLLPPLAVLTPWLCFIGALFVMAWPCYANGVKRALALLLYVFCASPFLWVSLGKAMASLQLLIERAVFLAVLWKPRTQPLNSDKLF